MEGLLQQHQAAWQPGRSPTGPAEYPSNGLMSKTQASSPFKGGEPAVHHERAARALERFGIMCYDAAKPKKERLCRRTDFTNSPTGTKTGGRPSVRCKCGGIRKDTMGIDKSEWVHPENNFEAICNPIAQAKILDSRGVDFNIVIGLCVGHDSLFLKYTNTLSTVLIVKDRVCGHNPIAAVYLYQQNYWGSMISQEEETL